MFGVGFAGGHSGDYVRMYRYGFNLAKRPALSLGSDINGFVTQLVPRFDPKNPVERPSDFKAARWNAKVCYVGKGCQDNAPLQQYRFFKRVYDFNQDGVAHIGLYPDAFQDFKNLGMTLEERTEYFSAADAFARMWDRIEARKGSVK